MSIFKFKWNTEATRSLLRHFGTAVGVILIFLSLDKYVPYIDFIQDAYDFVVPALEEIVGIVISIVAFLFDKSRFEDRVELKKKKSK